MAPQDCATFALGVHTPAPLAPKLPPCAPGDTPRNQAPQTAQGQRAAAGLQRAPGLGARARPGAGTQLPPGPPDGHQASGSAGTAAQPPGLSPFLGAHPHTAPGSGSLFTITFLFLPLKRAKEAQANRRTLGPCAPSCAPSEPPEATRRVRHVGSWAHPRAAWTGTSGLEGLGSFPAGKRRELGLDQKAVDGLAGSRRHLRAQTACTQQVLSNLCAEKGE